MKIFLKDFICQKVLNIVHQEKKIILWGTFAGNNIQHSQSNNKQQNSCQHNTNNQLNAILIIQPKLPTQQQIIEYTNITEIFANDIYKTFDVKTFGELNIESIYPATQKHYNKYMKKRLKLIQETPEEYGLRKQEIEEEVKHHQWIYNIIDGKAEADRILYRESGEQEGFILIFDSKYDGKDPEKMHILAIANNRSLYTIRELNQKHLELLNNIARKAKEVIAKLYGKQSYRQFFHYPPTFYHLHIHFMSLDIVSKSTQIERCHDLLMVIQNISLKSTYYKDAILNVLSQEKQQS